MEVACIITLENKYPIGEKNRMLTPSFTAVFSVTLGRLLQSGVRESLMDVVASLTPIEAAAVGGGGIVSVGVVRWLVNRTAAGSSGTAAATSVSTTASTTVSGSGSAGKHKVAFTLPSLLPVSRGIREVTHNEIHAIELGLVVGVALTWLWNAGHTEPVLGILVAFVAGSLGFKRYGSKAFKTIRLEPWYALLALAAGSALGWAIFIREPSLLTQLGV